MGTAVRAVRVSAAGVVQYRCGKCGRWKPVAEYRKVKWKRTKCGVHSWCLKCYRAYDANLARLTREWLFGKKGEGKAK